MIQYLKSINRWSVNCEDLPCIFFKSADTEELAIALLAEHKCKARNLKQGSKIETNWEWTMAQGLTLIEQVWAKADEDYDALVRTSQLMDDQTVVALLKGRLAATAEILALFMTPYIPDRVAITKEIMRRHDEQDFTTVGVVQKLAESPQAKYRSANPTEKPKPVIDADKREEIVEALGSKMFKNDQIAKLLDCPIAWVNTVEQELAGESA